MTHSAASDTLTVPIVRGSGKVFIIYCLNTGRSRFASVVKGDNYIIVQLLMKVE